MSRPAKCPHCDAERRTVSAFTGPGDYVCGTFVHPDRPNWRGHDCLLTQVAALRKLFLRHNLIPFIAQGKICECDHDVGAAPCMRCVARGILTMAGYELTVEGGVLTEDSDDANSNTS